MTANPVGPTHGSARDRHGAPVGGSHSEGDSDGQDWAGRKLAFGAQADLYDAARPGYPGEASRWCVGDPGAGATVVDLGAGTGKLTVSLLGLGYHVVAVEPDDLMRARLEATLSAAIGDGELSSVSGSAEAIPVSERAARAVVAGQAFHWFSAQRTEPELARVVATGGYAAAVWNTRTQGTDWEKRLAELLDDNPAAGGTATGRALLTGDQPEFGPGFEATESRRFHNSSALTVEGLVALASSRSATIRMSEARRRARLEQIAAHGEQFGAPDGRVHLNYVVEAFRARRRG